MDLKKPGLIIDNFSDQVSNKTDEYQEPIKLDSELNLASFRIQLDDLNPSKESVSNSPSDMRGLNISPIALIIEPFRNFTSESKEYDRSISKPQFINIVSADSDEENEDIEKSISLLTPNLKKLKFNQFTPTFPLKCEENFMSWDDVSILKQQKGVDDVNKVKNQVSDFLDLQKDSRSNGFGIFNEQHGLLDAQEAKYGKPSKDLLHQSEKETVKKQQEIQEIPEEPAKELTSLSISQSFTQNNETLIFPSDPKAKPSPPVKPFKKHLISKMPTMSVIPPLKKTSFSGDYSKIFTTSTPLIKLKKPTNLSINPARNKSKSRTSINSKTNTSLALNKPKPKPKSSDLPKLKQLKLKSKTQFVPYMDDWSKSMLKTHFNIDFKLNKDQNSLKSLVTKVVKKRNKIVKCDNVK